MIEIAILILIATIIIAEVVAEKIDNNLAWIFLLPIAISYLFYTISLGVEDANFSKMFGALSIVALISPLGLLIIMYVNKILNEKEE